MKTFNSIFANGNVKSIIAIAAVAISSVFGLSSCEKDNDAFNAPAARHPQKVEISSETFGSSNGSSSTTTTTYTTNNGSTTTTTTNGCEAAPENTNKLTAKDFAGTYKCTADDGKEWVIVLTENASASEGKYTASITVPEGEEVAAKTYDGDFKVSRNNAYFGSTETKPGSYNYNTVSFVVNGNKDNSNSFKVTLKLDWLVVKSLVFVKQ